MRDGVSHPNLSAFDVGRDKNSAPPVPAPESSPETLVIAHGQPALVPGGSGHKSILKGPIPLPSVKGQTFAIQQPDEASPCCLLHSPTTHVAVPPAWPLPASGCRHGAPSDTCKTLAA